MKGDMWGTIILLKASRFERERKGNSMRVLAWDQEWTREVPAGDPLGNADGCTVNIDILLALRL